MESLKTLDGEIEFWHTPGHTPDHICLLIKKNNKQISQEHNGFNVIDFSKEENYHFSFSSME